MEMQLSWLNVGSSEFPHAACDFFSKTIADSLTLSTAPKYNYIHPCARKKSQSCNILDM